MNGTSRINDFFAPIPQLVGDLRGKQNGESINFDAFPVRVTSLGL